MSTSKASLSLIAGLSAVLAQIDETAAPIRIQYDSRIVGPDGESQQSFTTQKLLLKVLFTRTLVRYQSIHSRR